VRLPILTLLLFFTFADALNLAKLRWSRWGKATATARGIDRGFRKKDRDTAVTVHSRYGTDVVLQPTDCP
jgi:hypothetical protein